MKLLAYINSIIAVLTLCSYLSGFVDPTHTGIFALFGLVYPYLLILNVFFIGFWLIVKWKYSAISIITLLLGFNHIFSFYGLGLEETPIDDKPSYSIGSFNINASYHFREKDQKLNDKRISTLKSSFLNTDTDFFCIQEYNHFTKGMLEEHLANYELTNFEKTTVAIASKHPILDSGKIPFLNERTSCVWVDVQLSGKRVRIYNVHLFSNRLTTQTEQIIEDADFDNEEVIDDIKYILGSYIHSSRKRVKEFNILSKHIASCPHPIILAGDFNDTPQSFTHRQIHNLNFQDAFEKRGKSLGYTYGGTLPLLRIDYTFADKHFEFIKHRVIRKRMSDHYPILTSFMLR